MPSHASLGNTRLMDLRACRLLVHAGRVKSDGYKLFLDNVTSFHYFFIVNFVQKRVNLIDMLTSSALIVIALTVGLKGYWTASTQSWCRCRPDDPCWPNLSDWRKLNESIAGNLKSLRPSGHVCYADSYSQLACDNYLMNFHNATWRVMNPGKVLSHYRPAGD